MTEVIKRICFNKVSGLQDNGSSKFRKQTLFSSLISEIKLSSDIKILNNYLELQL